MEAAANGGGGGETTAGGTPSLMGEGTLKGGYVLPETGQLAFLGPPQIEAVKLAVKQINAAGGGLGKQIPALVAAGEAGDQAVAPQSADRGPARGGPAAVRGAASRRSGQASG